VKAARYLAISREARFFLRIDLLSSLSDEELVRRLRGLRQAYDDLTGAAPHLVSPQAYAKAKAGIEGGEASYKDDPVLKDLESSTRPVACPARFSLRSASSSAVLN
jgi:hypothetical protein